MRCRNIVSLAISDHAGQNWMSELSQDRFWIGRDPQCEIVLQDPHVSRRHVRLEWVEGALLARNESAQGVSLRNGAIFEQMVLYSGDELRIGNCRIRLVLVGISGIEASSSDSHHDGSNAPGVRPVPRGAKGATLLVSPTLTPRARAPQDPGNQDPKDIAGLVSQQAQGASSPGLQPSWGSNLAINSIDALHEPKTTQAQLIELTEHPMLLNARPGRACSEALGPPGLVDVPNSEDHGRALKTRGPGSVGSNGPLAVPGAHEAGTCTQAPVVRVQTPAGQARRPRNIFVLRSLATGMGLFCVGLFAVSAPGEHTRSSTPASVLPNSQLRVRHRSLTADLLAADEDTLLREGRKSAASALTMLAEKVSLDDRTLARVAENLWKAEQLLDQARTPTLELQVIEERLNAVELEIDTRFGDHRLAIQQALRRNDNAAAQEILRGMLELLPDAEDPRHQFAQLESRRLSAALAAQKR